MTRKQRRLAFVAVGMLTLSLAVGLVLNAFNDSMVFFYSPSDLQTKQVSPDRRVRIGGLVDEGSIRREGEVVRFVVTDRAHTVPVTFTGILPDLFREGQGVVAEGKLGPDGLFQASNVLAKHDENYMPPEVADALKRSGQWQGDKPAAEAAGGGK
ncbi:MAG: cytochrome c maturation protein CcmE [Alphaproteobacteria bacterium]